MKYQTPKGTRDIVGNSFYKRQEIAKTILSVMETYGFRQVQTPMFESLELLEKDSGEELSDQIYKITDKAGRKFGLKSDITPPLARIVANTGKSLAKPIKFACYDRVYRYERPQKGRYREISQINGELFGTALPIADAEIVACFYSCYKKLGLKNTVISIGYRPLLVKYIESLGIKSIDVPSILKVIDKKGKISNSKFRKLLSNLMANSKCTTDLIRLIEIKGRLKPSLLKIKELLNESTKYKSYLDNLSKVVALLGNFGVGKNCIIDLSLARGSEYYTGIIFEAKYPLSNNFGSIGGGGRYDNMVSQYGGKDISAIGFSIGIDRVDLTLKKVNEKTGKQPIPRIDYFIAFECDALSRQTAIRLASKLRQKNKNVELNILNRSISKQLQNAKKLKSKKILIVKDDKVELVKLRIKN